MAWSGNFASSYAIPGNSYSPYIQMEWKVTNQSVSGNYSDLSLELWLRVNGRINYTSSMTGYLDGTRFTFSGNSGSNKWLKLSTKTKRVYHNSDGTASVRLTGSYHLQINFSGVNLSNMSVAKTVQLPTIAQSSKVPVFDFYEPFRPNVKNWVDLGSSGIQAASTSFNHKVWIMDGSTTLLNLGYIKGGVRWLDITPEQSNTILKNISKSESKSLGLWVQTTNANGDYVGPHVLKSATAYVDSSVIPVVTENVRISIAGNGKDKAFGKYMKGISKVHGTFNGNPGYGASIDFYEFVVQKADSGKADRTETKGRDVTRDKHFEQSGTYEAWGRIVDTRGRYTYVPKDGSTIKFTVYDYNAPRISEFNTERLSGAETTVRATIKGTFSHLANANRLRLTVKQRETDGSWTTVEDKFLNGSDSFNQTLTYYEINKYKSYDFMLEVKDDYGNELASVSSVSTAAVLFDFHADQGIGIGKSHEQGVLDVAGESFFDGLINTTTGIKINGRNIYPIETGKNSNGEWIKFTEGIMIAWHSSPSKSYAITSAWSGLYYSATEYWTFPIAFVGLPKVFPQYNKDGSGDAWLIVGGNNVTTSRSGGYYLLRPTSASVSGNIDYFAIGRWK